MNEHDKLVAKTIEMVAVAIQALDLRSRADDPNLRPWSEEDGWEVSTNEDCIEVTIFRCNRGFIERWYVPEIGSASEFNGELIRFMREAEEAA